MCDDYLKDKLGQMSKSTSDKRAGMRPNIRVSHTMNGRVKDFAERNDLNTDEAYRLLISAGLEEFEDSDLEDIDTEDLDIHP